jgi:hypothetical protein
MATPLVSVGRMTEHGGSLRVRNGQGSGMIIGTLRIFPLPFRVPVCYHFGALHKNYYEPPQTGQFQDAFSVWSFCNRLVRAAFSAHFKAISLVK